jgi:hypothetical protein
MTGPRMGYLTIMPGPPDSNTPAYFLCALLPVK